MIKTDILLATYNGANYLDQQLASVVSQTCSDWRVIARDDGSSDSTREILVGMAEKHSDRIQVLQDYDKNLGVTGNFSRLLENSSSSYTMFCDQDDVWLADKIEVSLRRMGELEQKYGKTTPILIHTDLKVVNKNLDDVADSFWEYQLLNPEATSLNRLLIQNNITGCTMIINKALKDKSLPIPGGVIMHDWWIALVAAGFGVIDHIPQATILYRQHGSNVEGAKEWNLPGLAAAVLLGRINIIDRIRIGRGELLRTQNQARLFLERYGSQLGSNVKKMIAVYADLDRMNWLAKRVSFFRYRFFQQGLLRNFILFFWL